MRSFYAALKFDPNVALVQPGVTRWHRLEADPTALDLEPGLAARIADPLWMIGRQWQFGELRGEDAGTPILASLTGRSSRLALRGTPATDGADTIWEPFVEAEEHPMSAYPALAAQAGLDFERALLDEGAAMLIPAVRSAYPFARLENDPEPEGREERLTLALFQDAALDGARLLSDLRALCAGQGALTGLPAAIAVPAGLAANALRAAQAWLEDWDEAFVQPADPAAWSDRRLEYHFDVDTDAPGGQSLHVEEYADGRLDWWSLRVGKPSPGPAAQPVQVTATRIPVPVRYAGMPANRYFEFEDGAVNFAATSGGPTSIAGMLVLEYALAAGTDWFHLPLTLDYGQTFTVDSLTVRDTFGRPATIERTGAGADGWSMFELAMADAPDTSARTFVLPAVVAQTLEGAPIEEVAFFRDEMANLVWATERTVPGLVGGTRARASASRVVHQELDVTGLVDAAYLYRMQTPVPLDWHPMVATQDPDRPLGTVLFRRKLLRRTTIGADGAVAVTDGAPRGRILAGDDGVFQVEENEIPRSGVVVTRSFQMARTVDGRRLLWLGRSKRPGIGEGASGLRFDVMTPVAPGEEPPVA